MPFVENRTRSIASRDNAMIKNQPARRGRNRRGVALYTAVMANALIVSLLGLTALAIVRIERRSGRNVDEIATAHLNPHFPDDFPHFGM